METGKQIGWINEPMNFTRGHLLASWIGLFVMGYVLATILKQGK
jgi:hypothetical protein